MKRDVIVIDEAACTGCGECIPNCPEGALQIIDGKARLVSDLFCDGLGACTGHCPTGAMRIEKREAKPYDERAVMPNIIAAGRNTIIAHLRHLAQHDQDEFLAQARGFLAERGIVVDETEYQKPASPCGGGCPGSAQRDMRSARGSSAASSHGPARSELAQWPVQLHLVNPQAPFFKNADLVVAADCAAFAYGDFHRKFLKDKALVIFCPKLDDSREEYIEKLSQIIARNGLSSISVVHMEVPCCFGVNAIVEEALKRAKAGLVIKDYTVSIDGELV